VDAGPVGEVNRVVVESEGPPLFFTVKHLFGQDFILLKEYGQVCGSGHRVVRRADHGFHAELV
jgi:hypothetical protein